MKNNDNASLSILFYIVKDTLSMFFNHLMECSMQSTTLEFPHNARKRIKIPYLTEWNCFKRRNYQKKVLNQDED